MEFPSRFYLIARINRPKTELLRFDTEKNVYLLALHAKPRRGEANQEIIRYFKHTFGIQVRILTGFSSKKKLLERVPKTL